jgi:hypothetical protein
MSKICRSLLLAVLLAAWCGSASVPVRAGERNPNPHLREGCLHCHKSPLEEGGTGTRIFTPAQEGPHAVVAHSCLTCHKEGKKNFWIVILPEGTEGGAVVHIPAASSLAPSAGDGDEEGFTNSHDSLECTKCHATDPGSTRGKLAEPFPFGSGGVSPFCRKCHDRVDSTHYPRGNRPRKSVTCFSCHQAHGSTLLYPALREEYSLLLIEGRDINPHGGKIFCLSCHRDTPQPGVPVSFRKEGDASAMCQRCHEEAEHHPLGVASSSGSWKMDFSDFPLEDESVTCVTCHDPYECDNTVTKSNPRFLRGGPYNAVEDFCVRCHEGRSVVNLNPHDQIDDAGNIRKKQCLYCHGTMPEEGFELGPDDFTEDLKSLCFSCHPIGPHPSGEHLREVPEEMIKNLHDYEAERLVTLPLEANNTITCVTCHNPHERGVLRGPAGVGADEEKRLRLATYNEICTPCHGRR